ncbi:MAG: protein kinase [Thermoanaerobaculia bacterium]|nr:protein kinase [Thermoanaerobaculia bacterium]
MIGTTLGIYMVSAKLGEGGMGEVWRATDEKLGRDVALKVLPAAVADDAERLARFQREARVLASLNHPSIATLFGLETLDGRQVLVMELVEGEDLSTRIERGPMPLAEALPIALQIAQALEAAHEKGIVHRDLKPANVKVRPDGTVKVLDFGLAKAWDEERSGANLSFSPTITQHHTKAGVILGTASYMAPEQAAGLAADRRADVWSFGVVFWEMLTGRKLFEGETVSHVLASVLKDSPDLAALPGDLPPALSHLVSSCLKKKPARRLQSIGDARVTLEDYLSQPESFVSAPAAPAATAVAQGSRGVRAALPWGLAALGLVLGLGGFLAASRTDPAPVVKASIASPDGTTFSLSPESPGPVAVSPDGRRLAFAAVDGDSKVRLFVRNLDAGTAHALSGTDGAGYPFWSPDSRWLGFFVRTERVLRKIDVTGGPPVTLCTSTNGKGGTWNAEGVIVFSPDSSGPLHRVSATGGTPQPLTKVDGAAHNSHRHPRFLPDGRRFLYLARGLAPDRSAVLLGSLDDGESREILRATSQAEYASGRLLFVRENVLVAQPFDPAEGSLSGEAVPLAEDVLVITGAAAAVYSSSSNGVMAFLTGKSKNETTLEWRDRTGKTVAPLGDAAAYRSAMLSPDGKFAVAQINDPSLGTSDLWVYEIARGLKTRFTFDPAEDVMPAWAPDSRTVYFASNPKGRYDVYRKAIEGAGEVELVHSGEPGTLPASVSPDRRHLLATRNSDTTKADLWVLPLEPEGEPKLFRQTEFSEVAGSFSPDGRWVAYFSDESGEWEVYVTPFPGPGRRWQVSTRSGGYPQWRADGREIAYVQGDGQIVSAEVSAEGDSFRVGTVTPLFRFAVPSDGGPAFSFAPDGSSFLVVPSTTQRAGGLLSLVVGWPGELETRR